MFAAHNIKATQMPVPAQAKTPSHNLFQSWALRLQRHDGRHEQVIKECKALLRIAPEGRKREAATELKFAIAQHRLVERPY